MDYPPQIEKLLAVLASLPGVVDVEARHLGLSDFDVSHLSLVDFGDLPHAAIRRSGGGLPAEALGQVILRLSESLESWRTLEFLSWQVRDWSRAGRNVQIRTRGLPPVINYELQLGTTLLVIIDFFVDGLDRDPGKLLTTMQELGVAVESSLALHELDWRGDTISYKGRGGK